MNDLKKMVNDLEMVNDLKKMVNDLEMVNDLKKMANYVRSDEWPEKWRIT